MKKLAGLFVAAVLCVSALSAEVNVCLNGSSGPLIYGGEIGALAFPELGFVGSYEWTFENGNRLEAGVDLAAMMLPYAGAYVSYSTCLNSDSAERYKWWVQYGGTIGCAFFSNDYVDEEGKTKNSWLEIPACKLEVLFTRKPNDNGFFFGIGPSLALGYADKSVTAVPGLTFRTGYRFGSKH